MEISFHLILHIIWGSRLHICVYFLPRGMLTLKQNPKSHIWRQGWELGVVFLTQTQGLFWLQHKPYFFYFWNLQSRMIVLLCGDLWAFPHVDIVPALGLHGTHEKRELTWNWWLLDTYIACIFIYTNGNAFKGSWLISSLWMLPRKRKSPVLMRNQVKARRVTEQLVSRGSGMLCLRVPWFEKRNSFKPSKYAQEQVWDACFFLLLSLLTISFMFYLHPWSQAEQINPIARCLCY